MSKPSPPSQVQSTHLDTHTAIQVKLNSGFGDVRNPGYKSDVYFRLKNTIRSDLYSHITVSVPNLQAPISYYLINDTNNKISINGTVYTLKKGNYNSTTFQSYLLGVLGSGWSMSLDSITNKFSLIRTSSFTIEGTGTTVGKIIGLSSDVSYASSYSGSVHILEFPIMCNFAGLLRLHLRCYNLTTSNLNSTGSRSHVLCTMPVHEGPLGNIIYTLYQDIQFDISHVNVIDHIHLGIVDDDGNEINFNHQDWSCILVFKCYFEKLKNPPSAEEILNNI